MNPSVCAVIVTFNRVNVLKEAIAHVLAQTVQPSLLIIADNNSSDGTHEFLLNIQENKNIRCLFFNKNIGSAGAISRSMQHALALKHFDYFWIMDDDTFYESNALKELLSNIEHSEYAMIGLHGANIKFGKKVPLKSSASLQTADYALIDGAVINTQAVHSIGTVNEKFFMMCDDHEFCMRLKKHGFKVGVLKNGADNRLYLGGQGRFTRSTLWRGYYSSRNHLLILREYFTLSSLFGYMILQLKLMISAALFAPDRFIRVKLRLLGIWHGIKGVEGKTLDPGTLKFNSSGI